MKKTDLAEPIEPSPNALFRFGKYAGLTVDQIPSEYLVWALGNLKLWDTLKQAVQAELIIRCKKGEQNEKEGND